jgi:arginase family enzyme
MADRPRRAPNSATGTFLNWPSITADDIEPGMIVAGGVPSEFTGSPGTRGGPAAIRAASAQIDLRWRVMGSEGVIDVLDGSLLRFRDDVAVGDIGDATIYAPQLERTTDAIAALAETIVRHGGFPVMLGGDHYISYPLIAGYHAARREAGERRIGYIQIDAHFDLLDKHPFHGTHWHGSNARRVAELEAINPVNMVWMGLYDTAWRDEWEFVQRTGATAMSIDAVREEGIEQAAARALEIAGDGCDSIYLTVDPDSIHHAHAPTGYVNLGGFTSREFLRLMRALGGSDKIGGIDFVEVKTTRDPLGATAFLAASSLIELLRTRILD